VWDLKLKKFKKERCREGEETWRSWNIWEKRQRVGGKKR